MGSVNDTILVRNYPEYMYLGALQWSVDFLRILVRKLFYKQNYCVYRMWKNNVDNVFVF